MGERRPKLRFVCPHLVSDGEHDVEVKGRAEGGARERLGVCVVAQHVVEELAVGCGLRAIIIAITRRLRDSTPTGTSGARQAERGVATTTHEGRRLHRRNMGEVICELQRVLQIVIGGGGGGAGPRRAAAVATPLAALAAARERAVF